MLDCMNNSYIREFIQHNLHLMEIKLVKQAYKLVACPGCTPSFTLLQLRWIEGVKT